MAAYQLLSEQVRAGEQIFYDIRILISQGWAHGDLSLEGLHSMTLQLTPVGSALVEDVYRRRTSAQERTWACRDAVLDWLRDQNGWQRISDFPLDARAQHFGNSFAASDLNEACGYLENSGLAKRQQNGSSEPQIAITDEGVTVVRDHGGEASKYVSNRDAVTPRIDVRNSEYVNIASQSPGATQSMHVSADIRTSLYKVADAMATGLPLLGISISEEEEAKGLIRTLRADAAHEIIAPSKVRRVLHRIETLAIGGSGAALGAGIAALAQQAAQMLGNG